MTKPNPPCDEISPSDWIIVPKWEKFQHYKNRDPLWIKVYTKLLHDPKFLKLSPASRGLLMTIWLMFASESGELTVEMVGRYGGHGVGFYQLMSLNDAGFIELSASKPLATKKEKEKEKESPSPLTDEEAHRQLLIRANDIAADWTGGPSYRFDEALDELERTLESRLTIVDRLKLWDVARRRERRTPATLNPHDFLDQIKRHDHA
jgi:hypothetical protein